MRTSRLPRPISSSLMDTLSLICAGDHGAMHPVAGLPMNNNGHRVV